MKILLGAIVTDMAGSVAGQSVRRYKGGHILQNKAQYVRNSRNGNNNRIGVMSNIFRAWSSLTAEVRGYWNEAAQFYTFPDKFGMQRNISGRALYTKLAANARYVALPLPDPLALDNFIPLVTMQPIIADVSDAEYFLPLYAEGAPAQVIIRMARLTLVNNIVQVQRASYLFGTEVEGDTTLDIKPYMISKFGELRELDSFFLTVTPYSASAFAGATLTQNFTLSGA